MTLGLLAIGLIASVLFSGRLLAGAVRTLRRTGLLPSPKVEFDGLLQELDAVWPLEEDECPKDEILAGKWDEPETLPLVA